MRRVDGGVDSQSSRGRKRDGAQVSRASKSTLRRLALEGLEERTLLSTLPAPLTQGQFAVGGSDSGQGNSSSPSVAVDPLNSNKLVAAWTTYDPNHKLDGGNGQITTYVQGYYSIDGGQTWQELTGDEDADTQTDFSSNANPLPHFAQTTDATVAFGVDQNHNQYAYLLSSTHTVGNGSGVLNLQRWDFSGTTPTQQTFTTPAYTNQGNTPSTVNPIYRWLGTDAALTPTLAVDGNVANFDNGATTPKDPFSGNVYVAWESQDSQPKNQNTNLNRIKLMASSDLGQDFTYQAYVNPNNGGNLFDQPRIAISQGSSTVQGGQVTIVYDNAATGNNAPFTDTILTKSSKTGGTDYHFDSASGVPIANAIKDGIASGNDRPSTTTIPIPVNITDPNFTALQNLTLSISLQYPTLANTKATLTSPDGSTTVTLWVNGVNSDGTANNKAPNTITDGTLTGANIGAATDGSYIGTVLDSTANRSIWVDGTAPYTAHFQPFQNLGVFKGKTAAALNSFTDAMGVVHDWTLTITDFRNETATTPRQLIGASLDFTLGNSDITTNAQANVATTFLNSGAHQYTGAGIQTGSAAAILAAPSIASDNTLGSHSPHQGRLYIAFTDDDITTGNAYTTSTYIRLYYSDNGGLSWINDGIVNDDNGLTDGFSTGTFAQPGSGTGGIGLRLAGEANVRPKLQPQVAVDNDTGTLVVSFFDTRNDASALRVSNYIAASTDGGASFAPEVYANPSTTVTDAITGQAVNLGPVPDNESGGNGGADGTFGFGTRQGLAVANGHIIPVWSSNQNAGSNLRNNLKSFLNIESANVTVAAGPRVISSTQGPVVQDTVNHTITFQITFDRAVDPTTFPQDGPTNPIGTSPLEVFYNNPAGNPPASPNGMPLRVLTVTNDPSDTVYTITVDTGTNTVGSYTYTLRPLVRGMIPYQSFITTNQTQLVPYIDTAVSNQASFTVTGHPGVRLTSATLTAFVDVYQPGVSTGSPTDLQIFLVAQDQTKYLLYSGTTLNQNFFSINPTIPIPAAPNEPLDQTYSIQVVDSVPNEQVFLYDNFGTGLEFRVVLNPQASGTLTTVTGNLLDQTGMATPGQGNYSVPTGRDSLPLIVAGPHVVSTSVTGITGVVSTGSDNLVNNDKVSSINVTFDRPMQVSSFTPDKILSIVGPTGPINTPQAFPSTGTSRTFAYNGSFLPLPKGGTLSSTILIQNTNLTVSSLNVQVNIADPNDANLKLVLVAPGGITKIPLVNVGDASGVNLTNTTFSDTPAANGLTSAIPGGAAPYSLTYRPAMPLAALAGQPLDGTWTLQVADGSADGTPVYRLNSWSLNITPMIPKGPGTELDSTLNIASYPDPLNPFTIGHLAVQLTIASTLDSDLQVYLVAPDGTTVIPLILSAGGNGSNFTNTTLDDNATIPIAQGAAPFSLTYKPASPLSALIGRSIEGTWTLRIKSPNNDASISTLKSWSLIATPQLTVTPVNPVNGGATTFNVKFPLQNLSGSYNITLSPNILSVGTIPAYPSGVPLDTNLNAGVDQLRGTSIGAFTPVTYAATAVPVAIPYATATPVGTVAPMTLPSQLNVPDNFAIQGDLNNGTLAGLTVTLNIRYYNDPDLTVMLKAPDGPNGEIGRTITLFMNVGSGGNTANFTNTTLSDVVNPLAPISQAAAPFFATFNPEFPLADFQYYMGTTQQAFSQGLWTLMIVNKGLDPGAAQDALYPPTLLSWSLSFQKPQVSTGLGEPVADRATVGFRLFNFAANTATANDTWTAVGPAGTSTATNPNTGFGSGTSANGANYAGPVSVVAVDPADPSGNTAYVGASSGGIWKTTDFLTAGGSGPTYIPLTDFGANYAINIGGIAIFDQNGDPNQSIIFAGTGDGQATTASVTGGNSAQGVGILRSTNGGASFTLLDSSVNVDGAGNPLPINSPLRDHMFVGTTTYKIVVDPKAQTGGGVIVYAALGGTHGGLWRSTDGGNHWTNLSAPIAAIGNAAATDVLLDPASADSTTGNLDILYAAFMGVGVFMSSSQGQALTEVLGNIGADNLIQNSRLAPGIPLTVNDANPNGGSGRILLAKPALTNNVSENILYQDWLYAAVENPDGTFKGLYITKDRGENWTKVQIASQPTPAIGNAVTKALPTNDNKQALNYDVTNAQAGSATGGTQVQNGNAAFSMTIDPLDPNIIYLGGQQNYSSSGLIRVDLTAIYDAHAFVPFASNLNDGGTLARDSTGRITVEDTTKIDPIFEGTSPNGFGGGYYLNLRHSPTDPFNVSATLFVFNANSFTNTGYGVAWEPLDQAYGDPLQGSTNIHQLVTVIDPLTGLTRLLVADDQGVFTGVYNADGSLHTAGIGSLATVTGSLNGNLQDEMLYYSAAQPSALAAQAVGALFYGSGIGMANVQSASDLLNTGNLTWTVSGPSYGDLQNVINTDDRGGTGIATDQTGGGSFYQYDIPRLGGDTTNFFRVGDNGSTTGLTNNFQTAWPYNNVLSVNNGVSQLGNFAVNPINGSQILIGSNLGDVFETTNKGTQWLLIGSGQVVGTTPADFDGTYAAALAYGAPDPGAPNGVGNLDNFIYVGTVGGHLYVTRTGGGPWTNLSAGLDGSSIVSIFTNPNRGSHEAYAVTLGGVYRMADSTAPGATWVNITGNLTQIQHSSFGDPTLAQNALLGYKTPSSPGGGNTANQLGGFRSIVADYRYAVPDPVNPSVMYPVLYVAGYGGVFRSLDDGQSWSLFPNTSFDAAPVDGGYLPSVDVTGLQLNLGAINPATGRATQVAGDPEVLLASTLGRGDFAIRLAPDVFPTSIALTPTTGTVNGLPLTNLANPFISGTSEISNFGNLVTISLIDENPGPGLGQVIGTGFTDAFGHFSVQINLANDPSFLLKAGLKNIGVQATDSSGARGNVAVFTYVLNIPPPTPPAPTLDPSSNTSLIPGQVVTNKTNPVFDLSGLAPNVTVALIRTSAGSAPMAVGVAYPVAGVSPTMITDTTGVTADGTYLYQVQQVDVAGNASVFSPGLSVLVSRTPPPAPTIMLLNADDTGLPSHPDVTSVTTPRFSGTAQYNATPVNFPVDILTGEAAFSASTQPVALNPTGVIFSPSTGLTVPAGKQVVAGFVTLTLTNRSPAGGKNIGNLTVELIGPGGQTFYMLSNSSGLTATSLNSMTFSLPAGFLAGPLSGAYTLAVGNGTVGDVGSLTSWSVTLLNGTNAGPTVLATTFPAPSLTYQTLPLATPLASGTYVLAARSRNLAGTPSYSPPLQITIKAAGTQVAPTIALLPADDTGIKGDGVTANHNPRFTGTADPGATVNIYAVINGQLVGPVNSPTTASTVNGSFTAQLSSNLTDGFTTLFAQTIDTANNTGPFSAPFNIRITTVTGDYLNAGAAQLSIFDPNTETYFVRTSTGAVVSSRVDPTSSYRDIPVQYDFNGDGFTDLAAYRFDASSYFGFLSPNAPDPTKTVLVPTSALNLPYGGGYNISLPASGSYGPGGTFLLGNYGPSAAFYVVNYPKPFAGGFVVPNLDIPAPAAYDGNGVAEIAVFRPSAVGGALGTAASDADSFSVGGPLGYYQASFTNPAIAATARAAGFVYQAGDIPASGDYDGVGHDEFAIYRPSTGQFFILNTPNSYNPATWTMRTVTLNLPGGPNVNDVPVSEDYDGNGKVDPSVYRPSNSTFYIIHSSTGLQQNIPFGLGNFDIASAGPLLYRLTALNAPGQAAKTDGYTPGLAGLPKAAGTAGTTTKGIVSARSFASAATSSTSSSAPVPTTIAVAAPMTVVSTPVATPTPATVSLSPAAASSPSAKIAVTIGAATPTLFIPTVTASKADTTRHAKAAKPKKPAKAVVETKTRHAVESKPRAVHPKVKAAPAKPHATAAATMKHVVSAKKGKAKV